MDEQRCFLTTSDDMQMVRVAGDEERWRWKEKEDEEDKGWCFRPRLLPMQVTGCQCYPRDAARDWKLPKRVRALLKASRLHDFGTGKKSQFLVE